VLLPGLCALQSAQAQLLSVPVVAVAVTLRRVLSCRHPWWQSTACGGILTVLAGLSQDTSGAFLDWEGNSLPWW